MVVTEHKYMTTNEVADLCRTSPETVRYWRHIGKGPASFKVGRRVLYDAAEVRAWLESLRGQLPGSSPVLKSRASRKLITPDFLEDVARVYRENGATGAPTKAVAEHFGVAPATASLYVKRARESNLDMGDGGDARARHPSADLIREVAAIYGVHFSTEAVAKHFNFSYMTALELLSLANTGGLLGDAGFEARSYAEAQP